MLMDCRFSRSLAQGMTKRVRVMLAASDFRRAMRERLTLDSDCLKFDTAPYSHGQPVSLAMGSREPFLPFCDDADTQLRPESETSNQANKLLVILLIRILIVRPWHILKIGLIVRARFAGAEDRN